VEAYGSVDELNSTVGVALAAGVTDGLTGPLQSIQNELFHLGADLCVREDDKERRPVPAIGSSHVEALETLMDTLSTALSPLANFVLPGGTGGAAALHLARTICRRAERRVITLAGQEPVGPHVIPYLNRLSDAFFVMARFQNKSDSVPDTLWNSRA